MKHFTVMDGADVEHFGKALDMLDQSIGELRRVAHHIMPESLMRCGLKVSLEDFVHAIPNTHFQYFGDDFRLDNHVEILIYRCAYELINNAVKYAHATTINVQIIMDSGIVSLTVQDDGIGFDPQTVSAGMGLENIRTRLALYNGQMTIHTAPNEGTEVCIEVMIR
jgi:signal transduction histidine kinase